MKATTPPAPRKDTRSRCSWARDESDALMQAYHDTEWGVPQHDDAKLFELLILEGAQAGLSWQTILRKRANYRKALDGFDALKIARYSARRVETLMQNAGIVRNRAKLEATVLNAKAFLTIQREFGSFDAWIWQFIGGKPLRNRRATPKEVPATTPQSDAMSKALRERGFKFVGSTICYAFMQATGMVDDHLTSCFRHGKR
jgi:DNA-3-methyladenine glycosylase I